jgi:hypothetical protein
MDKYVIDVPFFIKSVTISGYNFTNKTKKSMQLTQKNLVELKGRHYCYF